MRRGAVGFALFLTASILVFNHYVQAEPDRSDGEPGGPVSGAADVDELTISWPGYSGELSFALVVDFAEAQLCDVSFGWNVPYAPDRLVKAYYSASSDPFTAFGIHTYGDGLRVHTGPIDTRPYTAAARQLVSPLGLNGQLTTYVGFELAGELSVRVVGNGVAPHAQLGGAGLLFRLECEGTFTWRDLEGGTSIASATPEQFKGDGANVGFAAHDIETTKDFTLDPGHVRGLLYKDGAKFETGSLHIAHPEGETEWAFPGPRSRSFDGIGGTYGLTLQRTAVDPGSLFAVIFDSTNPVNALTDLSTSGQKDPVWTEGSE